MKLKKVELTGVVTLFYSEICSRLGIVKVRDKNRSRVYRYFRNKLQRENVNIHNLLDISKLSVQNMTDVAYRNYLFDIIISNQVKLTGASEIVNLGCGFDTRFFRLENFSGKYYDVDFKNVIDEKKKILPENDCLKYVATSSLLNNHFWDEELKLSTSSPVIAAEGVFCYIPYPELLKFVQRLFQKYPDATLICDVFIFKEHRCFNDFKSKILLEFPVYGEKIIKFLPRIFYKIASKSSDIDSFNVLKGIDLICIENSQERKTKLVYKNKTIFPNYWIGVYKKSRLK